MKRFSQCESGCGFHDRASSEEVASFAAQPTLIHSNVITIRAVGNTLWRFREEESLLERKKVTGDAMLWVCVL